VFGSTPTEVFEVPEGICSVERVTVEHEEILLISRWVDATGSPSLRRPGGIAAL
jgi:hypothetical protein